MISIDSTSQSAVVTSGSSLAWNHTVGSGIDRALIVGVGTRNSTPANAVVTGITYGGQALIKWRSDDGTANAHKRTELWALFDPPSGTAQIAVTLAGPISHFAVGAAISLFGADSIEASNGAGDQSGNPASHSITSLSDGALLIDACCHLGNTLAPGAQQTLIAKFEGVGASSDAFGMSYVQRATAGNQVFTWTSDAAVGWTATAVSVKAATGAAFVSAIARGRLDLSGRQIGIAYTLSVAPSRLALTGRAASFATTLDVRPSSVVLTGRDVGLQATGTTTLDVVRGSLRLTGRDVGVLPQQDVILNVTRGALALTGRPLSAAIVQAVTRGSLTLAGRTLAVDLTNTLPITRGALQFAGRDVGIFVGANVDVAVDRGTLALSGRAPVLASQISVARGSAALTGRAVSMAVVGSFQLSIDRSALSIGGRTLALEIEVPAAIAPVDATMIGPRRRGRLYPNIRFEPVRRRKDEPPELVEASVPGAGLGSRPPRQAPTTPGTGLRARGPAVAPAQQPTAPAPLPRAPQPPRRGRAAPAPTPATPLALDVLPGHLTLPGPQEAFEQRVAAGYPSAAEIAALVHAEFEQAHLANEQRQREERRRARNQAAIDLAVKTLLGK